jgi:thiol:disulfide interchange protein DsbD
LSYLVAACVLVGAPAVPAPVDFGPASSPFGSAAQDPITFEVLVDREPVRAGDVFRVAVVLTPEPGWHAYANPKGPGVGKPTVVTGTDQEGFTFGPARYLPGTRKAQDDIAPGDWVYAYTENTPVFLEVTVAPDVAPGQYTFELTADALACKQSCLPVRETLAARVTVAGGDDEPAMRHADVFARYDEAKPGPAGEKAPVEPVGPESGGDGESVDLSKYESRTLDGGGVTSLWVAILFGFIAGVFLNVMPCVLPVLSIKVMSLVAQAHEERGRIFRLGLAFGAGIMVVFLILATLAAAAGYAWGEHFQSEAFIVVMIGVVFVFALGLFDVYIILVPGGAGGAKQQEGYVGSFFKGVLTTFLATPCSGPFLGATLAWALTQPAVTIFTVFTSVGLGMAAPYMVLSAFPALMKFVPKPGTWMEAFKNFMGFLLLGTVVYLFSILRSELVGPTLAFCLILALGAYMWGRYAHGGIPVVKRWIWRAVVVLLAAGGAYLCYAPQSEEAAVAWEPFSVTALDLYGLEERTVVLDFTADWCPNCKVVEKFVLESDTVQEAFAAKDAVLMKADITRATDEDPAVRLRDQLGSKTIPFLAIFPGDEPYRPYILRDMYTRGAVLEILERCPDA